MKGDISNKLCCFPKNTAGRIVGYSDDVSSMPSKILEMGLLPDTGFTVLFRAPWGGPLYIEFGAEKARIALREEEARFIVVEAVARG